MCPEHTNVIPNAIENASYILTWHLENKYIIWNKKLLYLVISTNFAHVGTVIEFTMSRPPSWTPYCKRVRNIDLRMHQ